MNKNEKLVIMDKNKNKFDFEKMFDDIYYANNTYYIYTDEKIIKVDAEFVLDVKITIFDRKTKKIQAFDVLRRTSENDELKLYLNEVI